MLLDPEPFTAIVLAAQRPGEADPLAAFFGVSHKCLVPIDGRPLIGHVVAALLDAPGLCRIRICIEPDAFGAVRDVLGPTPCPIDFVAAADNLADSVHDSARGIQDLILVTTADNVLLTPGAIADLMRAFDGDADVAVALTTRERVLAAHPDGQRRFYRFADASFSNCNLYGLAGAKALRAAEAFRTGGRFSRNPVRILAAFGLVNLLLLLSGRISLATAMRRISRRFGVRIKPVILEDGAHAIDVDNRRTYGIATQLLQARRERQPAAADPAPTRDARSSRSPAMMRA